MACLVFLSACSIPAPKYSPTYDNVQLLQSTTTRVNVIDFTVSNPGLRSISLRGNSLISPHGNDMVDYLQTALKSELKKAGLLDQKSNVELTAIIKENDIDTAVSVASGVISADFSVRSNGSILYSKNINIKHEWESSFVGAIAIPAAAESYKVMTEKMINRLFSDRDFIAALRRA